MGFHFLKKVHCPHCGLTNLVPRKASAKPRCVCCGRPLSSPDRRQSKRGLRWAINRAVRLPSWTFLILGLAIVAYIAIDRRIPSDRSGVSASEAVAGTASVIDGDTIEIHGRRIRLWGIDAPESAQTCKVAGKPWRCGQKAALALSDQIKYRVVKCQRRDTDRYARMVAVCTVGGRDIGGWLVSEGWAVDYTKYSHGAYAMRQALARSRRHGLWQGEFDYPWEWRRQRRSSLLEHCTRPLCLMSPLPAKTEYRHVRLSVTHLGMFQSHSHGHWGLIPL